MRTEQEARERVTRLLEDAGLSDEAEKAVAAWQAASERFQKLSVLGPVSHDETVAYQAAFETYYDVYDRAGVWT